MQIYNTLTEKMKITKEEVEKVAKLARLDLPEEEAERMAGQLDGILAYVEKLNELDTKKVKPTSHPHDSVNAFREDKVRDSLPHDKALANAPADDGDSFTVPRIIT